MEKKNIWKVACVYTTTIIGAGFASGQELLKFFADYGKMGVLGLLVSGLLFGVVGWGVLEICFIKKFSGYRELMGFVFGEKFGLVIEIAVAFFMYVLFSTMLAGVGAAFQQVFQVNFTLAVSVAAVLTFILLLFDMDGLVALNLRIAPFLVAGGLLIGVMELAPKATPVFSYTGMSHWFLSAIVYTSYNIISAISVLAPLSSLIRSKKAAKWSGFLGGGVMTLLGLAMAFPLFMHYAEIRNFEIPLLSISKNYGSVFEYIYFVVLLCAIFTTAISSAFALVQWITDRLGVSALLAKIILALAGCVTAHIGFSVFVAHVYPIFSFIGFFEIVMILIVWWKIKRP